MSAEQMGRRCLERDCQRDGHHVLSVGPSTIHLAALDGSDAEPAHGQALGIVCHEHRQAIEAWLRDGAGAWCIVTEFSENGRARTFLEWRG